MGLTANPGGGFGPRPTRKEPTMTETVTTTAAHTAPAACKLLIPAVFNYGMRSEFRLLPGSIVKWTPEDGDLIRIWSCGYSKVVSIDNATPMEWDAEEEMWVEA